jgi:FtsH-binding integral membrane protein
MSNWQNDPRPNPNLHDQQAMYAAQAAAARQYQEQAAAMGQMQPRVASEARVAQFMSRVFGWMTLGLGLTAAVAWWTFSSGFIYTVAQYYWGFLIGEIGLVVFLMARINRMSAVSAIAAFLGYAGLNGLTLSFIFAAYQIGSITQTFLVTTMTFGFMAAYGFFSKKDLTSWGSLGFMALIGIIVASVLNAMFFHSGVMGVAISIIGVLVFVGLTAYDSQRLRRMAHMGFANEEVEQKGAIIGALGLYLNFINLFLMLLRLMGGGRD